MQFFSFFFSPKHFKTFLKFNEEIKSYMLFFCLTKNCLDTGEDCIIGLIVSCTHVSLSWIV